MSLGASEWRAFRHTVLPRCSAMALLDKRVAAALETQVIVLLDRKNFGGEYNNLI